MSYEIKLQLILECLYNKAVKKQANNYQQKILAESAKLYTLQLN